MDYYLTFFINSLRSYILPWLAIAFAAVCLPSAYPKPGKEWTVRREHMRVRGILKIEMGNARPMRPSRPEGPGNNSLAKLVARPMLSN